jgi:hypothetical protein
MTNLKQKATVITRASSGGGEWIFPIRIYLAVVNVDKEGNLEIPKHFSFKRDCFVRFPENLRATKRVRNLEAWFNNLADDFNSGKKTWQQVEDEIYQ